MEPLTAVILAVIVGAVAYSIGRSMGWRKGVDDAYHPIRSEGYYDGWLTRHAQEPLEDTRVHPDDLKKLVPSLESPEISNWSWHGDHLTFEEYRCQQVADLNAQLREQISKNDSLPNV